MPGTYKLFTAIVALIGNVSLVSTGEMNPAFSFIGVGLLCGYYRSLKNMKTLSKWGVGSLSLSTFLIFLLDFYVSGDIFISVAQMTLVFQTIKSFDIKDSWDPPQVFFMSLLQLLIASELTSSLTFGIVFLLFLVFIVIAVLLGHFVKEGQKVFNPFLRPISMVTVFILILTVIVFVILPRLRSSIWGKSYSRGIETTGFSERVDFGSFGEVKLDETVVVRMVLDPDIPGPHYLRGMTFDHFNGSAWYDNLRETRNLFRITRESHREVSNEQRKYEADIYLEPMNSDVIFTYKLPYMFQSPGYFMRKSNSGSFFMKRKVAKRFHYRVFSVDGSFDDSDYLGSYLQMPDGFIRVGKLTEEIVDNEQSDIKKAYQIRDYLLKNFRYSLYTDMPEPGSNAVEHFLFTSRKGYCEHFATAMTLMLRSINIPARLVTGFLGSQKNTFSDYYVIKQSDAHSWVEAYVEDKWVLFDPTPPLVESKKLSMMLLLDIINMNWNRYVVGFSNYDQTRMLNYARDFRNVLKRDQIHFKSRYFFVPLFVLILIVTYMLGMKLTHSSIRKRRVAADYERFRKLVLKKGGRVVPSSTSEEVLREAYNTGKFNRREVQLFIESYRRLRFSGKEEPHVFRDFLNSAKNVRSILK